MVELSSKIKKCLKIAIIPISIKFDLYQVQYKINFENLINHYGKKLVTSSFKINVSSYIIKNIQLSTKKLGGLAIVMWQTGNQRLKIFTETLAWIFFPIYAAYLVSYCK